MTFRVLALISTVCQLIMLYGSQSLTGLIGVAGAVIAALIFFCFPMRKKASACFGWSGCCVYCCGGLRARCKTRHFKPIYGQRGRKKRRILFRPFRQKKNSFEIVTGSGKTVVGGFTSTDSIGSFSLKDKKGKTLETATNNNVVTIAEKRI